MREHAVADIDKIPGTGTEIFVFGREIARDLRVERRAPGMVVSGTGCDGRICSIGQRVIFQHRNLEFQDVRHLALKRLDQSGDLGCRRFNRRLQRGGLLCGIAARRSPGDRSRQHRDRSDGKTRRGGTASEMDLGHGVRPRQNRHVPAPAWRRAPPRRRDL